MIKTNHGCAAAARRELIDAGFVLAFSPPGTPESWQLLPRRGFDVNGSAYTVVRQESHDSTVWEIVNYPQG